jgi:hypothetical protein
MKLKLQIDNLGRDFQLLTPDGELIEDVQNIEFKPRDHCGGCQRVVVEFIVSSADLRLHIETPVTKSTSIGDEV